MLDEQGQQNFFNQIHELYIQPELERRWPQNTRPEDFRVRECLIKLPKLKNPIVEFNDEIGWVAEPELAPGVSMEVGQVIYVHDIQKIAVIYPPEVDDIRVAFIYLFWNGFKYCAFFDFTPNDSTIEKLDRLDMKVIEDHQNRKLAEMTITLSRDARLDLQEIGLWGVTSLLPYPISKILERLKADKPDEARDILIHHCDHEFIQKQLVETWPSIAVFASRKELFDDALWAHKNKRYRLSIYTLIPQIEGIITDWLYEINASNSVNWRIESKVNQFNKIIDSLEQFEFTYREREALNQVSTFLVEGPPLQTFKNWLDRLNTSFPNRHDISHGRYDEALFSEENSIKLFLLLDTICHFIMLYEAKSEEISGNGN